MGFRSFSSPDQGISGIQVIFFSRPRKAQIPDGIGCFPGDFLAIYWWPGN
jgi:hypothetical protein